MHVAFARSDSALRAAALATIADPAALEKLSDDRQSYVVFASDAMAWWIDDQGNAGAEVDQSKGYGRHEAIIMLWFRAADEAPSLLDVFKALRAERRGQAADARAVALAG